MYVKRVRMTGKSCNFQRQAEVNDGGDDRQFWDGPLHCRPIFAALQSSTLRDLPATNLPYLQLQTAESEALVKVSAMAFE